MKVLITGGTGYIGRHVAAQACAQGWTCAVTTRGDPDRQMTRSGLAAFRYDGSLAQAREVVAAFLPDCVVHLAAAIVGEHVPEDAERILLGNVVFPCNLLEAMREHGCRLFVNTASFWQHYDGAAYRPTNFYAASKQAFEDVLAHYVERGEVSAASLVLYDNYGANDERPKIVRLLVEAALAGTPLEMTAGEQVIDLTHVDDIAQAYAAAIRALAAAPASAPAAHRWFVTGERMRVADLVALVERAACARAAWLGRRPYRPREIFNPVTPGAPVPGWTPTRTLAEEVAAMIAEARQ
jgi:nucleoside-diphosphate-sugar epimerase